MEWSISGIPEAAIPWTPSYFKFDLNGKWKGISILWPVALGVLIHNASHPRWPNLWIRVLVCPWEVFSKQGEYDLGSIGNLSQVDYCRLHMSSKWRRDSDKIVCESDLGQPKGRLRAPGRKKTSPTHCFRHQCLSKSWLFWAFNLWYLSQGLSWL